MKANTKYAVYEKYKESGIAWLGRIPIHWQVSLLKRRYQITLGKMLKSKQTAPDETEAPYLRAANIQWRGVDTSDVKRMWFSPEEKKKLQLCKGDLLVSEGGDVGRSALWDEEIEDCYIQNSINRIRAREDADTRFLYYWMYFIKHAGYIDMICNKATIAHFTVEKVGATPCVYPPLEEQNQIAAFLDKETAKMDALVEKQEQLITLLREKRQAIISHAVTRGLNSNVKMKDSGIEWLGEVPTHWEVKKIKHILLQKKDSIKVGPFGSQLTTRDMEGTDIKVINQRNVIDNDFDFGDNFINYEKYSELRAFTIFPGDILITTRGTIGRTAIFPNKNGTSILHPCLMRLQVDEKYWLKELIALIIHGSGYFLEQLKILSNATTIDVIYSENLKNVTIALPPTREEQKQIIAFLDKETTKIDTLIEKCETAIDLLKERRTALIAAAVTGKIDVRKAT